MIKKDQENVIDIVKNTHYNVFKFLTIRNAVTGRMDGVNLREGIMEVAFEQWTERTYYTAAEH